MIWAVFGSGVNTTLIKKYARYYAQKGLKVLVTTSTHMAVEEDTLLTDDAEEIIAALEKRGCVMAGRRENGKFSALSMETFRRVCPHADLVLMEADGSNRRPVKFPAHYEPVIYDGTERITVVCGLHGLGMRLADAAHRPELVKDILGADDDTVITASHIQTLVRKGYLEPLKEKYPDAQIDIYPTHDGSDYRKMIAEKLKNDEDIGPARSIGCVIMASGKSRRFGSNKLLAEIGGRTLLERILDVTDGDIFAGRVVVTGNEDVRKICESRGVDVVFNGFPGRNDTVRLGTEYMHRMDGCIFCPCDQPLLKRESLQNMAEAFSADAECENRIFRLSFGKRIGAPVLFGRNYFSELCSLPPKRGGSYLMEKYAGEVRLIQAADEAELDDIDTQEDMAELLIK